MTYLTPKDMELRKLMSVLSGDKNILWDRHLSIMRSDEERADWDMAIDELIDYIREYDRNSKIIQKYKEWEQRRRTGGEAEREV